jgi:two-component system, chemotaxis family, chemotaxis protein CheY
MMPEMDGQQALLEIRNLEKAHGIAYEQGAKIIMTTALGDMGNVMQAFKGLCDGYLKKPIDRSDLIAKLTELGLISQ